MNVLRRFCGIAKNSLFPQVPNLNGKNGVNQSALLRTLSTTATNLTTNNKKFPFEMRQQMTSSSILTSIVSTRTVLPNYKRSLFVSLTGPLTATMTVRYPHYDSRTKPLTLYQMHLRGPHQRNKKKKRPLDGKPFMKGVVLKTLIKKPRKPNSGNRKCVLVRLSNGKEKVAHVPGIGHTLQEHNIVLIRVGRLKDVPGVKLKVVRGKYDCGHVVKKSQTK